MPDHHCDPPMWQNCQLMAGSKTKILLGCNLGDWCPVHCQIPWHSAILASAHHHAEFTFDVLRHVKPVKVGM